MNQGQKGLEEKVLRKNMCTACGACLGLCPYLKSREGKIIKLDDCDLSNGRCYAYCPRSRVDWEGLQKKIFDQDYKDINLGTVREVRMARAKEPIWKGKVQTGGVVSALIDFALREGIIHSAVLTQREKDLLPSGRIVSERDQILSCSGSGYISGPTLEALNQGSWQGEERIGVVGLPCQILALAKMKESDLPNKTPVERVVLTIGLFCTWALGYKPFKMFLEDRFGLQSIQKLDITPPPERLLKVWVGDQIEEIPLDEIRDFIRPACQVCPDMTSEFADLSVGTVEGVPDWNTVIVRTERGKDLLSAAVKKGIIETQDLPEENRRHLQEASRLKKQRALTALKNLGEPEEEGYLNLSADLKEKILEEKTA
jgi:coenzyme F420 hydrogenase subunit beta